MTDELAIPGVRPRRRYWRVGVVVLAALVAGGTYVWRCHLTTYRLATVDPGVLYRDGLQSPCQFETAVRKVRPLTVVSLVGDDEMTDASPQFQTAENFLADKGIRLERIPLRPDGWPAKADVERFLAIVSEPNSQPVLVHGALGVRRTGMMVAVHQMRHMGYDKQRAKAEIMEFDEAPERVYDVKRFIDGYDPETGSVPENLMPSLR